MSDELTMAQKQEMLRLAKPGDANYRGLAANPNSNIKSADARIAREAEVKAQQKKQVSEIGTFNKYPLHRETVFHKNRTKTPEAFAQNAVPGDEGGGGSAGTFKCTFNLEEGSIAIGKGSYQYPIGTNVDVPGIAADVGKYAYACIKQASGGGLATGSDKFKLEVTSTAKDAINMDAGDEFVEWSNILLAEVVGTGNNAKLIQRRVGNLSLIYRLINGKFCLWGETTVGSSL